MSKKIFEIIENFEKETGIKVSYDDVREIVGTLLDCTKTTIWGEKMYPSLPFSPNEYILAHIKMYSEDEIKAFLSSSRFDTGIETRNTQQGSDFWYEKWEYVRMGKFYMSPVNVVWEMYNSLTPERMGCDSVMYLQIQKSLRFESHLKNVDDISWAYGMQSARVTGL
jgi:hypothetical protein